MKSIFQAAGRSAAIWAVVIAIFLVPVSFAIAEAGSNVLWDFGGKPDEESLVNAAERQQALAAENVSEKPALRVNWDAGRARYFELLLKKPVTLPKFDSVNIHVEVYIPEKCQARSMALRLVDRDGETFQFSQSFPSEKNGWQTVTYRVDAKGKMSQSWGGKPANGQIDFPVSFSGYAVGFAEAKQGDTAPAASGNWLALGKVTVSGLSAPPDLTLLIPGAGAGIHVMTAENEIPAFRITNQCTDRREYSLHYQIRDAWGVLQESDAGATKIALDAGQSREIPLPRPGKFGVYGMDVEITEPGQDATTDKRHFSYCYMHPAGPTPGHAKGFLFGVQIHPWRDPDRQAMAAAWCGAKIVRTGFLWDGLERPGNIWNWDHSDWLPTLFNSYNIDLQITLQHRPPRWLGLSDATTTEFAEHYLEYVRRTVERYHDRVHYWEIMNEPDLDTRLGLGRSPSRYAFLLSESYKQIKSAAPEAHVMTGGFARAVNQPDGTNFIRPVLREAKGSYDIVAIHEHGSFDDYQSHINDFLTMRQQLDITAPWYANETAAPSNWPGGELVQALTLFKKRIYSQANGSIGYTWYDLRNDGFDSHNGEHNFGLLTYDFFPKAAYGVYNMLAGAFREAEFLNSDYSGAGVQIYTFRSRDGGFLFPVWRDDTKTRLLCVTGIESQATLIDIFGNETTLAVVNGSAAVPVSDNVPVTLCVSKQTHMPVLADQFISGEDDFNVTPGAEATFHLPIHNPTQQPLTVSLACVLPAGMSCREPRKLEQSISLPSGGQSEFALPLQVTADFSESPLNRKSIGFKIDMRTAGGALLWNGVLQQEVNTVRPIPVIEFAKMTPPAMPPSFNLYERAQVSILVPSAPENERFYWKGEQDLSAKIWLGRDNENLLVKTIVADNVHWQPERGMNMWKGDSIQLAIQWDKKSERWWEIGLSRRNDGESEVYVWSAAKGFSGEKAAAQIKLQTYRDETAKCTVYEAAIPFSSIGLTPDIGARGFRFNLLVNDNDNDGAGRKNFISLAPGIGETKTPNAFRVVYFK